MTWRAPVRDISFALNEVAGLGSLAGTAAYPDLDAETVGAVLEAAGKFSEDVLAPLNKIGDQIGAKFENGSVTTAPSFAQAYRAFAEGGWNGLAAPAQSGGQGLPRALALAVFELVHGANMAFGLCPMLTQGAIEALLAHGTDRQKRIYLPKLVTGEWTGTMNLTEPQAGSDLGALRMRAEPDSDGGFRLTGQKIFITWGDHDMAGNIIHLVLARIAGAPEGSRGISMFLAPKRLVGDDGAPGAANNIAASGIEHKLGIHGSPTCTMIYDGAKAELVGEANAGLSNMFTMMNAARLQVGVQGVAIGERAYQQALAYALERRQGRSVWSPDYPARLIDHPDVRRALVLMKAKSEAARAICVATAMAADLAQTAEGTPGGDKARLREELFTPIAKAWSTDIGVETASLAIQVHGGMGYIEETGVAQHLRDARIAPIYEGTNGIQAIDLVGRKLSPGRKGEDAVTVLLSDINDTIGETRLDSRLAGVGARLANSSEAVRSATDWLISRRGRDDALAGAAAFLELMGNLAGGWLLAKGALAAARREDVTPDVPRLKGRIRLARIFSDHVLTRTPALLASITAGADDLREIETESLAPA